MNEPEIWTLDTRLGWRVLVYRRLDSTNTFLFGFAHEPDNDGLIAIAREQTAGRGQHGRTWLCPPESGVLMSVLLFPPPHLLRPALLTAWAAYSIARVVEEVTACDVRIKWPNDVFVRGKKICGILIEQQRGTIVGIGLNVNQSESMFASCGLPDATSLAVTTGQSLVWETVARRTIAILSEEWSRLEGGDIATLEKQWQTRLGVLGEEVMLETTSGLHCGKVVVCGWAGIGIQREEGYLTFPPEAIQHIRQIRRAP